MIKISSIRHSYPENAGFTMDRKHGHAEFTFLHFYNSVQILQGGAQIQTRPHAVILFTPGTPQFFHSPTSLAHDWMHFSGDGIRLASACGLPVDTLCYPANPAFITKLISEMEYEFLGNQTGCDRILEIKTEELFLRIGRALLEKEKELIEARTLERFHNLRSELFASLGNSWTIRQMADRVYLSESRFYALYKAIYGISPTADLINAKVDSAKNMLFAKEKSVEEIAQALGYQNTTHFIRQFKERTGTTPARYKREL